MTGWLLDTNVLSAFAPGKAAPRENSVAWFRERFAVLFVSVISVMEIEAGVMKLRRAGSSRRADTFAEWLCALLASYEERVPAFDLAAARWGRALRDRSRERL